MPTSEKKPGKLLSIVIDMLAENASEKDIIASLVQMGVSESDAKLILKKAMDEVGKSVTTKLEVKASQIIDKKLDSRMKALKKELALQLDLKAMEQKEYTDKKVEEVKSEIEALKEQLSNVTIDVDSKVNKVEKEVEVLRVISPKEKLFSSAIMLGGVVSVVLFFYSLLSLLSALKKASFFNIIIHIIILAALVIVSIVFLKTGFRIYSLSEKKLTKFAEKVFKKEPEKKSIQELVREEDLV